MRLFLVTRFWLLVGATAVLASCGGGSSSTSTTNTPASITVSPTSFSLDHGAVAQIGSVQVLNSSNTAISPTPTVTYASAAPSLVTVTSSGLVCAGVFDANNVVCQTQADSTNPVNITVSAGGLSTTVPVFVHGHVDNVVVSGPANPPVCVSQNQTEQFTAKALNGTQDITAKVGPFTWSTANSAVASSDQNGVVTSREPGTTTVVAAVANTTGTPALIVACPPKAISLHLSGATDTTFNVATATGETLAADVTDILGQPITNAALTFSSYLPSVVSVTSAGSVTTPGAGQTAIVASCTPPTCNPSVGNVNATGAGLAVYSNPVIGTVTGSTATTVYVTGSDNGNTSLVPITISSNTAGTAITLAGSPNSMVFSPAGTKAYIGSTAGMLIFDPTTNAVTGTAAGITGTVLSVSNDGNKVIVSDTTDTPNKVFVYDVGANTTQVFDLTGVTAANFDSDNSKAYLVAGTNVYEYSPTNGEKQVGIAAGPTFNGVAFTPQLSVAYLGGSSFVGLAACNDAQLDSATGAANVLAPTPDGTHMVAAGTGGWIDLSYTISNANGCPPSARNTVRTAGFGAAFVGTPTQIAVTSNDSYAFLTGYTGGSTATGIPFYHFADAATGTIPLSGSGGTLFSGSLTEDATSLYVGVSDGVHRIDLTQSPPVDANQISVSFTPRIVVVRPQ